MGKYREFQSNFFYSRMPLISSYACCHVINAYQPAITGNESSTISCALFIAREKCFFEWNYSIYLSNFPPHHHRRGYIKMLENLRFIMIDDAIEMFHRNVISCWWHSETGSEKSESIFEAMLCWLSKLPYPPIYHLIISTKAFKLLLCLRDP